MIRKNSKQRNALLENLISRYDHPTADMLFESLHGEYPRMSLGTVYRNLALLVEDGKIRKISCGDGIERYDGHLNEHSHFICKCCGQVLDLELSLDDTLSQVDAEKNIGCVDAHSLILYGYCKKCLKNKK